MVATAHAKNLMIFLQQVIMIGIINHIHVSYIYSYLNQNQRKSKHFPMLVNIFYITAKYAIHYKTDTCTGFLFMQLKTFFVQNDLDLSK